MRPLLLILLISVTLNARADFSAARYPNERFETARQRLMPDIPNDSASDVAVEPSKLKIPELPSPGIKIPQAFQKLRDTRFMEATDWPGFNRRISWLFPQDGCWTRAGTLSYLAHSQGLPRPKNIFIFGELEVETKNTPTGSATWWFHVASLYQDEKGKPAVFDPAVEPGHPLTIKDWILRMADRESDVTVAICNEFTTFPSHSCAKGENPSSFDLGSLAGQKSQFLGLERSNLTELGRDPAKELGEAPPWTSLLTTTGLF